MINWKYYKDANKYNAYNKDGEFLGYLTLHTFGKHTHWGWMQMPSIIMSHGCLQEVRDKQKELYKDRKVGS